MSRTIQDWRTELVEAEDALALRELCKDAIDVIEASEDRTRWQTPRNAPANGTLVRVWIDECDGFEHSETHYVWHGEGGRVLFRHVTGGGWRAACLWRLCDEPAKPDPALVAQAHREAAEDDE